MVVEGLTDSMYAGNYHLLRWGGILDDDGETVLDLTGKVVKFALARFNSAGIPLRLNPVLAFRSDDVSPQVTIPDPLPTTPEDPSADAHVLVELLPEDTEDLAPAKDVAFYFELEVEESDGDRPVVVSTGTLTIKLNVENPA